MLQLLNISLMVSMKNTSYELKGFYATMRNVIVIALRLAADEPAD